MGDLVVVCGGRPVDDRLRPAGDRCTRVYRPPWRRNSGAVERMAAVDRLVSFPPQVRAVAALYDMRPPTAEQVVQQAMAAGWAVGPRDWPEHSETELVGTCPSCRRPPPEVVELVMERKRINEKGSA